MVAILRSAFAEKVAGDLSQVAAIQLLMAIGAQVPKSGAGEAIALLVSEGQVGEAIAAEAENIDLAAVCVAAVLSFAPTTSPQALTTSARRTDRPLGALLSGTGLTKAHVEMVRVTLQKTRRLSSFVYNLALREQLHLAGAMVLSDAIDAGATFNIRSWTLLKLQPLLVAMANTADIQKLYERIEKPADILEGLKKGNVSASNSFTYLMVSTTSWGKSSRALRNRLQAYVEGADASRWKKVIDGGEQSSDQMLLIVSQLEEMGLTVGLGASVSDAILDEVKSALGSGSPVNPIVRTLAATLDREVLRNLPVRLWAAVLDAKSADGLNSLLSLFADALLLSDGVPLSSILNGPASVILTAPQIDSVRWLAQVIGSRQSELLSAGAAAAELRTRVIAAHKNSQDKPLKRELNALKALLPAAKQRTKAHVPVE